MTSALGRRAAREPREERGGKPDRATHDRRGPPSDRREMTTAPRGEVSPGRVIARPLKAALADGRGAEPHLESVAEEGAPLENDLPRALDRGFMPWVGCGLIQR